MLCKRKRNFPPAPIDIKYIMWYTPVYKEGSAVERPQTHEKGSSLRRIDFSMRGHGWCVLHAYKRFYKGVCMKILCFEIKYVSFGKAISEWQKIALTGNKIGALKAMREVANVNHPHIDDPRRLCLKEAKEQVEAYMQRMGVDA